MGRLEGSNAVVTGAGSGRATALALADDLGADGIRVNAVCPGVIETPLTASYFGNAALVADLRRATPLRRWGQPAEIAALIVFLASEAASFGTGAVFAAAGGYTASKGFG